MEVQMQVQIQITIKSQTQYKNYRIGGGEKTFEQWSQGERHSTAKIV